MSQTHKGKGFEYYKELLSCLSDGELSALEAEELLTALPEHPELRTYWFRLQIKNNVINKQHSMHAENLYWINKVHSALQQEATYQEATYQQEATHQSDKKVIPFVKKIEQQGDNKNKFSHLTNLAIAASVMLMVTVGWLGSQTEFRSMALAYLSPQSSTASNNESLAINQFAINRNMQANKVLVSAGNMSHEPSASVNDLYLSESRIHEYMLLHAEQASLNTNQGMLPFARMSKISSGKQF